MGLLDSVIGGVLGQVLGGNRGTSGGSGMSPVVKALLMLLLAKGASGGFGDIFGRGSGPSSPGPDQDHSGHPQAGGRDNGDLGGFNQGYDQSGARRDSPSGTGEYGDLAGMLDGPGDSTGPATGAGPYAQLDREPNDEAGGSLGGLDGLFDRLRRNGLGDALDSWIGHGQNRPIQPNQLADALGPDTIDTLEQQTGLSRDHLLGELVQVLPGVINGLTPHGRVPNAEERQGW